jgi:hypothetical protein
LHPSQGLVGELEHRTCSWADRRPGARRYRPAPPSAAKCGCSTKKARQSSGIGHEGAPLQGGLTKLAPSFMAREPTAVLCGVFAAPPTPDVQQLWGHFYPGSSLCGQRAATMRRVVSSGAKMQVHPAPCHSTSSTSRSQDSSQPASNATSSASRCSRCSSASISGQLCTHSSGPAQCVRSAPRLRQVTTRSGDPPFAGLAADGAEPAQGPEVQRRAVALGPGGISLGHGWPGSGGPAAGWPGAGGWPSIGRHDVPPCLVIPDRVVGRQVVHRSGYRPIRPSSAEQQFERETRCGVALLILRDRPRPVPPGRGSIHPAHVRRMPGRASSNHGLPQSGSRCPCATHASRPKLLARPTVVSVALSPAQLRSLDDSSVGSRVPYIGRPSRLGRAI